MDVGVGETLACVSTSEPLWEAASTETTKFTATRKTLKAKAGRCFRKAIDALDAARLFEKDPSITMRWLNLAGTEVTSKHCFLPSTAEGNRNGVPFEMASD